VNLADAGYGSSCYRLAGLPKKHQIESNRRPGAVPRTAPADAFPHFAWAAAMAQGAPASARSPGPTTAPALPAVRLEVRHGSARSTSHDVSDVGFLIGSVPGCDLRLPGADLPPVVCLIARHAAGATLRKLVPTQPVLVNGRPVSNGPLADGDRIALGAVELHVHISGGRALGPEPPGHKPEAPAKGGPSLALQDCGPGLSPEALEERARQLDALQQREQALASRAADEAARSQRNEESGATELSRQQQELAATRQELADIRRQLYDRYRERRDRLAGLQQAVRRAARKVQERKRLLDDAAPQIAARQAALDEQVADLAQRRQLFEEEKGRFEVHEQQLQREVAQRLAECQARDEAVAQERAGLEQGRARHQADLVRLDRLQAALEQRQQDLEARAREVEERFAQAEQTSAELEEQARRIDEWHSRVQQETEELARRKADLAPAAAQLAQRTAALEGQQAMLASLRTRLERMREEVRRDEQQVAEQRARLEAAEADVARRAQELQQLRADLDAESQGREQERRQFAERSAVMEKAVAQLRQLQESLAGEEERLQERIRAVNAAAVDQSEEASVLRQRAAQVQELQQRLAADRQALREREAAQAQVEQVREALQEQLRRRSEELSARQRALTEQARRQEEALATLDTRQAEIEHERRQAEERLAALQHDVEARAAEQDALAAELARREEQLQRHVERLKEGGRGVAAERKVLAEERARWEAEHRAAVEALERERADLESARQQSQELRQQLPDLELRAQAAGESLAQARAQLREHLGELHAYARQCHDELEALRAQAQAEAEQVRQQGLALHRARDEHRLAVAAFRQQLIEWQGQVAEMKRSLAHGETRLERRQARVEEQARQIDATSARLAQQAEQLQEQERTVADRRHEVERHLADMREWYRQKLRELTFGKEESAPPTSPTARPEILPLTGELEPGDQQLGDRLRSLDLIDADTLTALLVEARKQRRSLRQALLAGGYLTLYQIALIEADNLDALMLGPLRVIDRLRATARETVYRVFDPRHGREAVLRHLAEPEMLDAVHPDEFRQRFAQAAAVPHPHLAATYEVLEIGGRPAALQEWLTGLPDTDWPALAGVPGVWYRLLCQAALALHTAHQAALVHGRLRPGLFVLTPEGILKLCGLGEPAWLTGPAPPAGEEDAAADVRALGELAAAWANLAGQRPGGARPRALPAPLGAVLDRLTATAAGTGFASAAALLEELERSGAGVPANGEAWQRLLRHVAEHATGGVALRQSA
jgi:chromosome segregation ATPase